jgi:peroxin-19
MDLDAILQQTIDEFEEDAPASGAVNIDAASDRAALAAATPPSRPPSRPPAASPSEPSSGAESFEKLLQEMGNPESFEKMLQEIGTPGFQRDLAAAFKDEPLASAGTGAGTTGNQEPDASLLQTLALLQRLAADASAAGGGESGAGAPPGSASSGVTDGGSGDRSSSTRRVAAAAAGRDSPPSLPPLTEADLERMAGELASLGVGGSGPSRSDSAGLPAGIDGMMKQLVSKEIMYEPLQQICQRFPSWIAENTSRLSSAQVEAYRAQHAAFRRVIEVYDSDPGNFPRLLDLLGELQEHGQPPLEIVHELAPGLDLGFGGGAAAAAAGTGAPLPAGGLPGGECAVM